ncbi:MAG TPA: biotin/lipoyl-containing protein, partial [Caulobacteraceae bacterium]
MTDIMTPALGESVTEATVARWTKQAGEPVRKDEVLVELETDKVSLEVVAPEDGVLSEIAAAEGETVEPGAVLGRVTAGAAAAAAPAAAKPAAAPASKAEAPKAESAVAAAPAGAAEPRAAAVPTSISGVKPAPAQTAQPAAAAVATSAPILAPSAERIVQENKLDPAAIAGTGKDGRITKGDALAALESRAAEAKAEPP